MSCKICGADKFVDYGTRKLALCTNCNSLERTRALWLTIEMSKTLTAEAKVLHLAPEAGIAKRIQNVVGADNYKAFDFDPRQYSFPVQKIDLTKDAENLPTEAYDLVIHSHVMEHLPCSFIAVLYHLHRAMKPGGRHIFCVPIMSGHYSSSYGGISPEERTARFGQADHVRWFGRNDLSATLGMIFKYPDEYDLEKAYGRAILEEHSIPEYIWRGYGSSSIFSLRKNDIKLHH